MPVGLIQRCVAAGYRAATFEAARPRRKQAELLDDLIGEFDGEVLALTARLEAGEIAVGAWQSEFEALIARYHTASLMLGLRETVLAEGAAAYLLNVVATQYEYLANFGVEIQDAAEWEAGFTARAEMYAGAIREPYWTGDTQFLPLPAMPTQGTQCLSNCGCEWQVVTIDAAAGDFDAYWRRGKQDSCPTCLERERLWNPVQIRGWELQ